MYGYVHKNIYLRVRSELKSCFVFYKAYNLERKQILHNSDYSSIKYKLITVLVMIIP